MCALILGRIVSESRSIVRKRKVVVDSLRAVDIGDRIMLGCEELGNPVGSGGSIVAADCHKKLYVVVLEQVKVEILLEILVSRLEPAHFEIGASPVEIPVRLEEIYVLDAGVPAEKSGISAVKADDPVAF